MIDGLFGLFGTTLGALILIFLVMLSILWIVLPFAVFRIKDLQKEILTELRVLNGRAQHNDDPVASGLSEAFPTFSKMLRRKKR